LDWGLDHSTGKGIALEPRKAMTLESWTVGLWVSLLGYPLAWLCARTAHTTPDTNRSSPHTGGRLKIKSCKIHPHRAPLSAAGQRGYKAFHSGMRGQLLGMPKARAWDLHSVSSWDFGCDKTHSARDIWQKTLEPRCRRRERCPDPQKSTCRVR
jgi:hypothetical protein